MTANRSNNAGAAQLGQKRLAAAAAADRSPKRRFKLNQAKSTLVLLVAICAALAALFVALAQAEHHHEEHKHHKFNPYKYGYKVIDHKGNKQWKQEESHHPHEVKGSYGYKDKHGMFREVSYIADKHGFRAHVKTNEPGTAPKSSAGVKMEAHPDPSFHKSHYGHEASHGHH